MMSSDRGVEDMLSGTVANLNIGDTTPLECERAFSLAKEGGEVVLDKSQDPDGKLEATLMNLYGLHRVDALDDGTVVLALHTDTTVVLSNSVTVDAELEGDSDEDSSPWNYRGEAKNVRPGCVWKLQPKSWKITDSENWKIAGRDQTVWAESWFKRCHCRGEDGSTTCVRLVLNEINFGVDNCFTNKDEGKRGFFIYKVTIQATPVGTWHEFCEKVWAEPSPTAKDVSVQDGYQYGIHARVAAGPSVDLTAQRIHNTTTLIREFGWSPCELARMSTKSATWTWELMYWKGVKSFKLDQPSSFALGALPKLPQEYNPTDFSQNEDSFVADAYWEIPEIMTEKDLARVEWEIEIKLHCTFVEKALRVRLGKALRVCKAPTKRDFKIKSIVKYKRA